MAEALLRLQLIEELEREAERGRRIVHARKDPFSLDEDKFIKLYRLNKTLTRNLIRELTPFVNAASRSSALSVETKVFATLRFFAGGPYQAHVASDEYTAMDQSSVSRCITEIATAISQHLMPRWISLELSPQSVARLRQQFFQKYNFPGCIGAIDCTHVAIVAPPINHPIYMERHYFNHKRYHSINVQLVCDASMYILNVNARYPGATNDAYIYANSALREGLLEMQRRFQTNAWLIGDSGYPLESCLLTPVAGDFPPNSPEERYNRSLCQARSVVERCNGLLKARWRCLLKHRTLHYLPEKASTIINACCVLHNMCIAHQIPLPDGEELDLQNEAIHGIDVDGQNARPAGRLLRERIIQQYFT